MLQRLGAFEILFALKSGGMGDVLLGRRRGPGGFEQLVAVKTIRAELAASETVRTMFLDEARLLARLTHPAIATVHDFGEHGGALFLAMEYVAGIRFKELAQRQAPPAVIARAFAEACRGLHAAHELRDLSGASLGVVHRDISPENLMLGFDGQVKVLDFGIALVKGRMTVTEHGTVKGKPPYMSPEQVRGQPLDRRSDVFSVALVMHEVLTGQPVFDGDSIYAVARAVADAPIAPPSIITGALPAGLDDAIMGALERDLAARTPTAAALADALERVAAAARGESLQAWADRALASERDQHRAWLSELVGGGTGAARLGRRSGVLTVRGAPPKAGESDPGMIAFAKLAAAAAEEAAGEAGAGAEAAAGADAEAAAETETEAESDVALVEPAPGSPARPRRTVLVAIVLLLLAGTIATLLILSGREPSGPATAAAPDTDAVTAPDAAPAPDAVTAPDAATATATDSPPIDAGRSAPRRDAAVPRPPIDAAAPPPPKPVDAAPTATASPGFITITPDPFVLVRIDGRDYGTSPIYRRRLPAGRHDIELRDPSSGDVSLRKTIDLAPGDHLRIP